MHPFKLPIYEHKQLIINALAENQVIVVESPTGSGKTTQIPQILYEAGYAEKGIIGVTQPRRIATLSVTEFIARQMDKTIPDTVGYSMRFEDQTDNSTRIKIMTDGILLQEIKGDYDLSKYSLIMVDEAHERSLNIDFILGLLKRALRSRPDFKVIISSATINAEIFSEYFDQCPIVKIEAPAYPVEIIYDPPQPENNLDAILQKISKLVSRTGLEEKPGDILIFLPGEGMIKSCVTNLGNLPSRKKMEIIPLYSRLAREEQEKVFHTFPGKQKVIIATNIAETSITIDGVTSVIDPGLAKINFYNPQSYTSSLVEVPISKASANQRKGRAGRTQPGKCYRLYQEKDYERRPLYTLEEIYRTDLSEVILRMAEIGISDFENFDFIAPPSRAGIISAVETLRLLDAIDENRELTAIGKLMVPFPILPRLSRMVVESILKYPRVLDEVLIAASFLSTRSPFLLPHGEEIEARKAHHTFRDPLGDFVSYLKLFRKFTASRNKEEFCTTYYLDHKTLSEICNIKLQLQDIAGDLGMVIASGGGFTDYLCSVSRGLIQFVCARSGRGVYKTLTAGKIQIHPGSVMFKENPDYIVAGEIVKTSRTYARSVSPLRFEWLRRISPLLHRNLSVGGYSPGGARKKRDFTNHIKIGSGIFKIILENGKRKTVLLPWQEIKPLIPDLDPTLLTDYRNLRGKILYHGLEILSGVRLKNIIQVLPYLHPEMNILNSFPRNSFSPSDLEFKAKRELGRLLELCRGRKKQKQLGFLALYTDGKGNYWFKCVKGFHLALNESLASLEALADEPQGLLKGEARKIVNSQYRNLALLLEKL